MRWGQKGVIAELLPWAKVPTLEWSHGLFDLACASGDLSLVTQYFSELISNNVIRFPRTVAKAAPYPDIVRFLVTKWHARAAFNSDAPIMAAVHAGNSESMEILLGITINSDHRINALSAAIESRQANLVATMLNDKKVRRDMGSRKAHFQQLAAATGDAEIIKLIESAY
jgi:hypothetical protein